jgi:Flp pilus assembly protein TadD
MIPFVPAAFPLLIGLLILQLPPNEVLHDALRLQSEGNYAQSAERFREVLKTDPSLTAVHSNLGFVLSKLGRFQEAAAEYRQALQADPANFGVKLNLALSLYKMGRFAPAAEQLQSLTETQPENMQVAMLLADCWLQLGENQKVVTLLRPIEKRNPGDMAVAYLLGTALIRDKHVAEGQPLVDRILSNGESAEAHFLLGTQMSSAGDYPAAVAQFGQAVRLNPELPSLQAAYGKALLTTGDPDGAQAAFERELARNPSDFDANLLLGEISLQRGSLMKAEPLLLAALQLRPDSYDARVATGELLVKQRRYPQAQAVLEPLAVESPKDVRVHQNLAAAYDAQHDGRGAHERVLAAVLGPSGTLHAGQSAPDFTLPNLKTHQNVRLRALLREGPVVLVLGSYTCPNFRQAAGGINRFYRQYGNHLAFYMVYIREAHAVGDWQTARNERENISMQPATTLQVKTAHASLCVRQLKIDFPVLVDGLDGQVEGRYAGWPSRLFVINSDGTIAYTTGLSELEFHPEELQSVLNRLKANRHHVQ